MTITYNPDYSSPTDATITLTSGGTVNVALAPGSVMRLLAGDGHEGATVGSAVLMPLSSGGQIPVVPSTVTQVS